MSKKKKAAKLAKLSPTEAQIRETCERFRAAFNNCTRLSSKSKALIHQLDIAKRMLYFARVDYQRLGIDEFEAWDCPAPDYETED